MKKLKAFNMIKKAVAAVMVVILLSVGIVPGYFQPVYVYADLPDWLRYATTHIATGMGAIVAFTQGEVEQGLRGLYETWQINRVWNQGVSFDTFLLNQLHHDENNNTITVDHDLYELIVEYIKSEQNDPNSGVTSIVYKQLRVDKMVYGDTAGDGSDNYYYTYAAAQHTGDTIYSLNDIRNILDMHNCPGVTNMNGPLRHKFNLRLCTNQANEYFQNNRQTYDEQSGFYSYKPFYRQQNPASKILNVSCAVSTSNFPTQFSFYLHEALKDNRYDNFYIVGSFTNEFTDHSYSLSFYQYDSANDRLVAANRRLQTTGSIGFRRTAGTSNSAVEFISNCGVISINTQGSYFTSNNPQQHEFLQSIAKDDAWYKDNNDIYYIPFIRSDNPGIYKVFPDTTTLLQYIHNGGKSSVVNNNKTVHNVTINKTTNNITYTYEPQEVTYPEDQESPAVDYTEQFNLIFQELNNIKVMIRNIDVSGGSGSDVDLSTIEEELSSISEYLEDLEVSPEVNVTVECPWDESTRNQLLADIATIKSDLASIKTLLQGISNNINTNLPAILEELQNIKDTLDNLDVSGGGLTQTQIDTLINKMNEIKVVIGNNNVTVSGNSCNWSDDEISHLNFKIDLILEDMDNIKGYLNYIELNQLNSEDFLSQILFHVASIDTKMNIKKKVTDTDDNLTWLIHQLTHFLDNEMEIPESIMQMLGLKFPFSIPYILVAVTHLLEAPPQAPVFHVPINLPNVSTSNIVDVESDFFTVNTTTPGADYDFVLDFTQFSEVAEAFKFFMLLIWILGLVKLTPAMLGNGKEIVDEK